MVVLGGGVVSYERGTPVVEPPLVPLPPRRFRAKKEQLKTFEGLLTLKARPEYGLDCLICVIFPPQR